MNNIQITGSPNDVIWGAANVYSTARVVRGSRRQAIEKVPLENTYGIPTGSILVPGDFEYEIEMECQSSVNLPNRGEEITAMSDANVVVQDVVENWVRKGIKNARLTGFKHCA